MDVMTKSIADSTKQTKAKEVIKEMRNNLRDLDKTISNDNILEKLSVTYPQVSNELKTFFELLQDVPDEL